MSLGRLMIIVTPAQFAPSKAFYERVLSVLGYSEFRARENFILFKNASGIPDFGIIGRGDSGAAPTGNASISFYAPDRETVHKFHAEAL
jgi:hypothetical protein